VYHLAKCYGYAENRVLNRVGEIKVITMKKSFQFLLGLSLLVFMSFSGSAKPFHNGKKPASDEKELLYSGDFADFVYQSGKNSLDFYDELKKNGCWNRDFVNRLIACATNGEVQKLCQNAHVSYEVVLNTNAYSNAYYVNFLYGNPTYFEMDGAQQTKEYGNLISKICTDSSFRSANSGSPLVQALLNLMSYAKTKCGTSTARFFNLTWEELGGCLIDGLGVLIASNFGAIRTAWNLLTGNFSLGNVVRVLQLAFPEFSVASALVTTAACIVKEWIW